MFICCSKSTSLVVNLALHKNTGFGRTTLVGKNNNNKCSASRETALQLSGSVGSAAMPQAAPRCWLHPTGNGRAGAATGAAADEQEPGLAQPAKAAAFPAGGSREGAGMPCASPSPSWGQPLGKKTTRGCPWSGAGEGTPGEGGDVKG